MPSKALRRWFKSQAVALDQMENAHASVGGKGRGRRYTTDQINQAYAVLLASQFQGFCRDLHSESAEYLVDILELPSLRRSSEREFTRERKLDRGNANPGNLGADFGRLGIEFWDEVKKLILFPGISCTAGAAVPQARWASRPRLAAHIISGKRISPRNSARNPRARVEHTKDSTD